MTTCESRVVTAHGIFNSMDYNTVKSVIEDAKDKKLIEEKETVTLNWKRNEWLQRLLLMFIWEWRKSLM